MLGIPQSGTPQKLQSSAEFKNVTVHPEYRNVGGQELLAVQQRVDAGGAGLAGIDWYELSKSGSATWDLSQQGTVAPDTDHRWMGDIGLGKNGSLALGYSVASSATYPSIRVAGRLASDPPGMIGPEASIMAGSGSQTFNSRWGDYSTITVDPTDDSSFWYVNGS